MEDDVLEAEVREQLAGMGLDEDSIDEIMSDLEALGEA